MTSGLSARISATRLSHIGSSDNPPWPSATLWISSGPSRLVNETPTCAVCDCADALTLRRVQPINTALAKHKTAIFVHCLVAARLAVAPSSRLQELQDANASPRLVAE